MDLINGFGRASPGFGSDPPTGLGQARGSLHFSGIRASRIRFGPANRIRPRRGVTKVTRVYFDHVIVLPSEDFSVAPYRCKDVLDFFT